MPVDVHRAFDEVLASDLPDLFDRWHGLLPPVREVRGQDGPWSRPGQTRTILTADRGSLRQELLEVDRPRRFRYRIDEISGPMRPVIAGIDGAWEFAPTGPGTRITWTWEVHPANRAAALAVGLVARLWQGYAAQVLDRVEARLVP